MSALPAILAPTCLSIRSPRFKFNLVRPSAHSRFSLPIHLHLRTSFLGFPPQTLTRSVRRHVTNAGPPSPEPEDPLGKDPTTGLEANLYKIQDGVQIFFAVLFWMSLFFWASAWDGSDSGRPNKGSRFRR
ncbi:uncharacterized protein LOC131256503 [Magnolia sinica]|uniref:uncharacterized protein LOC131256503 n=1 Tax=Magnolia sinica TaxID=86752 RepID=UPI002658F912|nr:uncharacterized protein LOC131256503 [Magnolia sinica]